jgi:hypothetical protein
MPAKKLIIALLIIVVAVGGFAAGLVLLNQRQNISEQAAVPGGQAEVSISPSTGDFKVNDTISAKVSFNPANIDISGVAVRLTYPFAGSTPEISVASIQINSALTSSGNWTCPTQTSSQEGGSVLIDIACANTSASGFTANADTLLATINLKVNSKPSVQPFILRFDPALSVITRKADNQDILLIPTSTGTYTVGGGTVETGTPTPTSKLSPTATPKLTTTPTKTVTASPSAEVQLPDSGVSFPFVLSAGVGILMLVGGLLLAL